MTELPILIYTDGACSGNPGPGGWAAIVYLPHKDQVIELGGGHPATTNNRMELQATIEALKAVREESGSVVLYSDSKYVIDGITQWIHGWKARGWRKADKKDVLNRDLWEDLDTLANTPPLAGRIRWTYVAGHSGNPGNDRCDLIAVAFSLNREVPLYRGTQADYGPVL